MSDAHYLRCGEDGCESTGFAVVRKDEFHGVVVRRECKRCGSTRVEAGPDAPEARP